MDPPRGEVARFCASQSSKSNKQPKLKVDFEMEFLFARSDSNWKPKNFFHQTAIELLLIEKK